MTMDGLIIPMDSPILRAKFDELFHSHLQREQSFKNTQISNLNTSHEVMCDSSKSRTLVNARIPGLCQKYDTVTSSKTNEKHHQNEPDLVPSSFRKTLKTNSVNNEDSDLYNLIVMESRLENGRRRNSHPDTTADLSVNRLEKQASEKILKELQSYDNNKSSERRLKQMNTSSFDDSKYSSKSSDLTMVNREEYGKYRNATTEIQTRLQALPRNYAQENFMQVGNRSHKGRNLCLDPEDIVTENVRSRLSWIPTKRQNVSDDLTKVTRSEAQRHREHKCDLIPVEGNTRRVLHNIGPEQKHNDCSVMLKNTNTNSRKVSTRKVVSCEKPEVKENFKYESHSSVGKTKSCNMSIKSSQDSQIYNNLELVNELEMNRSNRKRLSSSWHKEEAPRKRRRHSLTDSRSFVDKPVGTSSWTKNLSFSDQHNVGNHKEMLNDKYKANTKQSLNNTFKDKKSKHSNLIKKRSRNNSNKQVKKGSRDAVIYKNSSSVKECYKNKESCEKPVQPVPINVVKTNKSSEKKSTLETIDDIHRQIADTNFGSSDEIKQVANSIDVDTLETLIPLNNGNVNKMYKRSVIE